MLERFPVRLLAIKCSVYLLLRSVITGKAICKEVPGMLLMGLIVTEQKQVMSCFERLPRRQGGFIGQPLHLEIIGQHESIETDLLFEVPLNDDR